MVVHKHAVGVEDCVQFQAIIRRDLWTSKRQSNDAHGAHRLMRNGHDRDFTVQCKQVSIEQTNKPPRDPGQPWKSLVNSDRLDIDHEFS